LVRHGRTWVSFFSLGFSFFRAFCADAVEHISLSGFEEASSFLI
jgi:hypothetical protein